MRLSVPHTSSANSSATPPPAAASAPDPKPDASETAWTEFSAELHTPPPANLPTNGEEGNLPSNAPPGYLSLRTAAADISSAMDSANYGALFFPPKARRNIWTVTDQPGIDLFLAGPRTWARLQQVRA